MSISPSIHFLTYDNTVLPDCPIKQRAARHGRSAEAEHRALLEEVLLRPKGKSFVEALAAMPDIGRDEDFARLEDEAGNGHVFS